MASTSSSSDEITIKSPSESAMAQGLLQCLLCYKIKTKCKKTKQNINKIGKNTQKWQEPQSCYTFPKTSRLCATAFLTSALAKQYLNSCFISEKYYVHQFVLSFLFDSAGPIKLESTVYMQQREDIQNNLGSRNNIQEIKEDQTVFPNATRKKKCE